MMDTADTVRFAEQLGGMTARTGWTWDDSEDAPNASSSDAGERDRTEEV
jgi:hypothetical protein